MILRPPFTISSRLLPSLSVGGAEIQLEVIGQMPSGRTRYRWTIDIGPKSYSNEDLRSGCRGGSLEEGFRSLLSFLSAEGERERAGGQEPRMAPMFPTPVARWASQHTDELSLLALELEEASEPLIAD